MNIFLAVLAVLLLCLMVSAKESEEQKVYMYAFMMDIVCIVALKLV